MIQFNLLPDVKLEHDKAIRTKKLVTSAAFLASAVSLAIFLILLLTVDVVQKKQLNDSAKSVDRASQDLKNVPQIDQIMTVQNQLKSLSALHANKHIASRIFDYFPVVTPKNVNINSIDLDLKQNTIIIAGSAPSQTEVNTFVDALKFATYKVGSSSDTPAFSAVVQSGYSLGQGKVNYGISFNFDPKLFQNTLDGQGKPIEPTLKVNIQDNSNNLIPINSLFNSSQNGGGH